MKTLNPNFMTVLQERWQRWALFFSFGLLTLLILMTLIYESYAIYQVSQLNQAKYKIVISKNTTPATPQVKLAEWHLFGTKTEAVVNQTQWSLRGVILGERGENLAIIASTPNDEAVYQRGDRLQDGSVIVNILPNQVVLSRNGRMATIMIPWKENQGEFLTADKPDSTGE